MYRSPLLQHLATTALLLFFSLAASPVFAQTKAEMDKPLLGQPGILITIVLVMIPVLLGAAFALLKANNAIKSYTNRARQKQA